jgi:lipopolysaccharide export system protein LptA
LGADIIREHKGIFQFEEFSKKYTFDGSSKTKNDPKASGNYGHFFALERRYAMKGDDYILRGANYLVSIDPALEVRQKLYFGSRLAKHMLI